MEKAKLVLANFDDRIPRITIKPKIIGSEVDILSKMLKQECMQLLRRIFKLSGWRKGQEFFEHPQCLKMYKWQ